MILLLVGSIAVNYLSGIALARYRQPGLFALLVIANLIPLAAFKYLGFFADIIASLTSTNLRVPDLALPLAISFFTFQQITYLSRVKNTGRCEKDFLRYGTYIAFFPQLIAGPIVKPEEFLPQLERLEFASVASRLTSGLALFGIGLAKKVLLADPLAQIADPLFAQSTWTATEASLAIASYSLQIYFDFSGYSDMALGLARAFGIQLPINFASPYKSTSLIDFWRRWHVTLSRFLRDFIYIPLGGNQHGIRKQYLFLFLTMFIGGLWHGAGYTFLAWGALHGVGLIANHAWRRFGLTLPSFVAQGLTLLFVCFCWVLFRAEDLNLATGLYTSLFTGAWSSVELDTLQWTLLALGWGMVLFGPNAYSTQDYRTQPNFDDLPIPTYPSKIYRAVFFVVGSLCLAASIPFLEELNAFIYFQF